MTDDRDRKRDPAETAPTVAGAALAGTVAGTVADTIAAPPTPSPSSSGSSSSSRAKPSIGAELRTASIDRFGKVSRDRFELLDELARGGLGRVFRARDPRTGRIVAIKEVLRNDPETSLRFAREAMVTANLQHPSIVPVYEVGRWDDGEPFYAMKLVDGRTLDVLIAEAPTLAARIALVPHVIDVADALAYAHGEHVIHRDLKPANVLVGAYGETVVIDWGLAKNTATGEEIEQLPWASTLPPESGEGTVVGSVLGTPAYMAPEQAIGGTVDERADVYAIGGILYHTLAGKRPFAEYRSLEDLLEAVRDRGPRRLADVAPATPPALIAIVETAMARDPAKRYPSAAQLAADLRRFQAGQLVGAHHYTTRERVRHWIAHHRAIVGTTAVAFGVLVVLGAIGVSRIAHERDEANHQREIAQAESSEARAARELAEHRFADGLQELGRQALIAHAPERALPILVGAAAARGAITPSLGVTATAARAAFGGLVGFAPGLPPVEVSGDLAPDGHRAVAATTNGELRAWDYATDAELWHATDARFAAIAHDGSVVFSASATGAVVARGLGDGREVARWQLPALGPAEKITGIQAAPISASGGNAARAAAATSSGRVFVVTIGTSAPRVIEETATSPGALVFSPSGGALANATDAGVIVSDPSTGATRAHLTPGIAATAVEWVDDDRLIAGDATGGVTLWHVAAKRAEKRPHFTSTTINGFAASAAGNWAVTIGSGDTAQLWSLDTGELRAKLSGHRQSSYFAAAAGAWLVTGDEEGGVMVWDPATGERVQSIPVDGVVWGLVARGDRILLVGEARERLYRIAPDAVLRHVGGHTARVRDLAFSGDDRVLWSASNDGTARGTTLADGRAIVLGTGGFRETPIVDADTRRPPNPHGMRALALSPDGALVVTTAEDGGVIAWDATTGAERAAWVGHTGRVAAIVFARDGKTAFTVGDTTLRRWDVATGKQLAQAALPDGGAKIARLGDGTIATMSDHHKLALWTAATLAPIPCAVGATRLRDLTLVGDQLLVASEVEIAFVAADGAVSHQTPASSVFDAAVGPRWFAAANARGEIEMHDVATAALVRTWRAGETALIATAFRPDGAVLATTTGRVVRLWDPATGALLAETPELPTLIFELAWSHDGTRLALAGGASPIWVWNLAPPTRAELESLARCASPWQLADAALTVRPFASHACAPTRN